MSMPPVLKPELTQVQRNRRYYISGGDLYFLVKKQLFRVHRYFFERESRVFREQVQKPVVDGGPRAGEEELTAIILEDVSVLAFETLLGVFYNPRYSLFEWTVQQWTNILELTQKWEFQEVHNLAIRELEKHTQIPVVERIGLYQRFNVDQELLVNLYGQLCSRPRAPTSEECEALGMKTTVLIFQARELLRARPSSGGMSPLPDGLGINEVCSVVKRLLIS